ncbi:Thiol-disulfide isomerase or thioredoxin [Chitinophaga jiangningensis]|uniref:Thiol-disulfide isomerase or thioredoxin n=1 Tax=Chitinophaga jiangningensis TaxID=1419482 RepID=A0A1M7DIY1_9BACT|nr:TlpA disulfide reductase family protein [Chitinophaga jiangningensis]SHL79347.1 Thiol-disulfide isomerase or thioredoxin [Chitinophaga jiangningensis]
MRKICALFVLCCGLLLTAHAQKAPNFQAADVNGKSIQLADYKGKYVLLDFWATWCHPCMAKVPFLKKIRSKYPESKLVMIGINLDDSKAAAQRTIKAKAMNWTHIYDPRIIPGTYGVNYIPMLYLIDPKGKIVYNNDRQTEAELLEILDQL